MYTGISRLNQSYYQPIASHFLPTNVAYQVKIVVISCPYSIIKTEGGDTMDHTIRHFLHIPNSYRHALYLGIIFLIFLLIFMFICLFPALLQVAAFIVIPLLVAE